MAFTIYDLFTTWAAVGVFDLLLPFLLIFAVIFGILASTHILGGNRGINIIIALVIALLAIRVPYVSIFFTEIFPRLGVTLSILLAVVILSGLFLYQESVKGWFIGFAIAGVVAAIIIAIMSFNQFAWFDSFFWQDYWGLIVGGIIMIIVIVAIFVTAGEKPAPTGITLPFPKLR